MAEISKELLELLVCPKCKTPVKQVADGLACGNGECGLVYPVRDGIPIMLVDEASKPATSGQ
jgi:uncharacterized protein YbaR (Trm112 family)